MASCLITVSGTSGEIRLNYIIAGIQQSPIKAGIGSFYIESTATSVTYTTLYGDAIASSICLVITSLPFSCYKWTWKGLKAEGYKTVAVIVNNIEIPIAESEFPFSEYNLPLSINNLDLDQIKVTKYKMVVPVPFSIVEEDIQHNFIVRSLGTIIPILKIRNADSTSFIHIHGTASTCSPVGYTDIPLCNPEIAL